MPPAIGGMHESMQISPFGPVGVRAHQRARGKEQAERKDRDADLARRKPDVRHARARREPEALGLGAGVAHHERGTPSRIAARTAPALNPPTMQPTAMPT